MMFGVGAVASQLVGGIVGVVARRPERAGLLGNLAGKVVGVVERIDPGSRAVRSFQAASSKRTP